MTEKEEPTLISTERKVKRLRVCARGNIKSVFPMSDPPKYWDTPSGEVIKRIVYQGKHSWREIRDATGLDERELNRALAILYNDDILIRENGDYRINLDLEVEYLAFQVKRDEPEILPIVEEPKITIEQTPAQPPKVPLFRVIGFC